MPRHWSSMRRDVIVGLALASHFVSAALLPASTLPMRPHYAAHTSQEALPEITGRATLESRQTQINSICGYWSANGSTPASTLGCEFNVPCSFENINQAAAIGYCSNGAPPVTAIFDYGACPFGGAQSGQLCCSSASPYFGAYVFNHGSSAILTCGASRFRRNATTAISGPVNASATTTAGSSQPTQAQGNNTTNSGGLGKWATLGIIIGVISGIVTIIVGVFAIPRYLRRDQKRRSNSAPTPTNVHFHKPVKLVNCTLQLTGVGDQAATTRLLTHPRPALLRSSSVNTLD